MLALLPYDYPVYEIIEILVPAVLTGNSVLFKDNPHTPVMSKWFEKALEESAPGLVQHFFIDPTEAQKLYSNRMINYVTFSGTYESALDIFFELGKNDFIDCNMCIGSLNSAYIDESISEQDLLRAAKELVWAVFYNSGQSRN